MPDVKMQKTMRIPTFRISSLFFLLLLTTAFSTPLFAQDTIPTDPAALILPEDQAMIIDTTTAVVLEWSAVDRAATYEAQVFFTEPVDGLEPIPLKTKVLNPTSQELLVAELLDALVLPQSDGDSTYHWRVRARNANGEGPWSEVWEFTLVPQPLGPIEWLALPADGTEIPESVAFEDTVSAVSDPVSAITYTLDDASLNLGMTLDSASGIFSWTPTESQGADVYPVTFTATSANGLARDSTITISVLEVNLAPVLAAIGDQSGSVNVPIMFAVGASDPDTLVAPPADSMFNELTFSLDDAAVAAGMTIDPETGEFTWTSATAGTFPVTVTVTDDGVAPMSDAETFNIVVSQDPPPEWLALPADGTEIPELVAFADTVLAVSDPVSTITYTLDDASLNLGMTLDSASGIFSWMPTESQGADAYSVTFTATTDDGRTRDSTITFQVLEVNLAPVLDAISDQTVMENTAVAFTAVASDPDTLAPPPFTFNTLTYTLDQASIDAGMTINPETGEFAWTSGAAGTFPVTVTVTDDGVGPMSASQTFNIIVTSDPIPPPPPPTEPESFCAVEIIGTFRWTNPVDDQGNQVAADSFFVEISLDRNFGQAPLIVAKTGTDLPDISGPIAQFGTSLDVLEIGPVHYWRVRAKVGDLEGEPSEPVPFRRWPAQVMIQNTLPFASANKSQDFRMISLPGAPTVEIGSTFSGTQAPNGPLTAGGNWDWSVWEDNKQETTYPNYVANPMLAADMFEPGVGYWAISTSAWTVPATQINTVTIVDDAFYPIPLNQSPQSMWTMIGNPFDFPVAWQDILGANPDITGDDQLWDWTGQRYEAVTILQPYKGYYFFNRDNRPQLDMPCYLEPATGKVAPRVDQRIAALKLALHEDRDGLTPALSDVTLSWYEEAEPGRDRFDHYVPPAQFESFRVSLVNENLETDYAYLSQEARPSLDEAQSFKLELKSIPNEPTYLRVAGLEDLANQEVYLFDEALGQSFNLHENPVVLLEPGQEISSLRLLVGDAAYISAEKSKLLPEGFKMQQSYPNPFVDQTTIEYALPQAEFVTIEIFNVLGQRVRTLVRDEQDAGYHRISWDGMSDAGDAVASGMYLYVFTSPSHRATERLVRVR